MCKLPSHLTFRFLVHKKRVKQRRMSSNEFSIAALETVIKSKLNGEEISGG